MTRKITPSATWSARGGLRFTHFCEPPNSDKVGDLITFMLARELVGHRPLTVKGLIACPLCGIRGYIVNGEWTPVK